MNQKFPAILTSPEGFQFDQKQAGLVKWEAVSRITAYKLDLVTTDEIRLLIEYGNSPMIVEVSEEQPGFEQFKSTAEIRFQFPDGWWAAVMKPAFAENRAVLFSRAEQAIPAERGEERRSR